MIRDFLKHFVNIPVKEDRDVAIQFTFNLQNIDALKIDTINGVVEVTYRQTPYTFTPHELRYGTFKYTYRQNEIKRTEVIFNGKEYIIRLYLK
mgnify:CR=1 FL=1